MRREVYFRFLGDDVLGTGYHVGPPEMRSHATDVVRPEYSLSYVIEGRGTFRDALSPETPFEPGSLIQRFPDRTYSIQRFQGMAHAEFFLILPDSVFLALAKTGVIPLRQAVLPVGVDRLLLDQLKRFVAGARETVGERGDPMWLMEALALVTAMLRRARDPRSPGGAERWLPRACGLLAEDVRGERSIKEIAAVLGIGYETFRKTFQRELGLSPGQYRQRKRFEHAIGLLLDQQYEIQDVAYRLGYRDVPAFAKQFAVVVGQSPARFRADHQRR